MMRNFLASAIIAIALCVFGGSSAIADDCHIENALATSVTIRAGNSEGSGTLFTYEDRTYVWTAGHVVEGLRRERIEICQTGDETESTSNTITIVEFADAEIVQEIVEDGRRVGEVCFDAEVLHYSDAEEGRDLAILRIRKTNFTALTTRFHPYGDPVPVGTSVYHIGSLQGQFGANSYTTGVISSVGRVLDLEGNEVVFDQTTVTAFPGSSGGGIYDAETGMYVGMLVRGSGEQFNFIVPIREMRLWCHEHDLLWALPCDYPTDPDAKSTDDSDLIDPVPTPAEPTPAEPIDE